MTPITCVINWQPSSVHGWGVYGLNVALNWLRGGDLQPVFGHPIPHDLIELDPLRRALLQTTEPGTRWLEEQCAAVGPDQESIVDLPVLQALSNDLRSSPAFDRYTLTSKRLKMGVIFFEDTRISAEGLRRAQGYHHLIAGSSWNEAVLRDAGCSSVTTLLQGVDTAAFHPHNKTRWLGERFLIYSGGKLEFRKGQDLVMRAVSHFIATHPDAVLVTAWDSPWQGLAQQLDHSGVAEPVVMDANNRVDVEAWAAQHGIGPDNLITLGLTPNSQMASIVRQMDVAVFPNRAEGGTNLVAMECMACGVPTIVSRNTGHLDLLSGPGEPARCFTLDDQRPVTFPSVGTDGWGESQVEEIVAQLERAYTDCQLARELSTRGADFMATLSWGERADALGTTVSQAWTSVL
jgi:glycosyltransferase involved in cell wall biosynthesis